jgi:hypothetical protein
MRSWAAIILAPSLALATQSTLYAMVTPSCATQSQLQMHAVAAVALLLALLLTALAAGDWTLHHAQSASADDDAGDPRSARRFLAIVGTAVAAISSLVIVAMWFGIWVLSPCHPWP